MNNNVNNDECKKKLSHFFNKIESYFKEKENFILTYKHIPLEEIFRKAPKYYVFVNLIEKINIMLSKDKNWLKNFIAKNNIKFDFDSFERWKAGKKYNNYNYSETQAPSKWVHVLQEYLIEILEYLQVILVMECYINENDYKKFLQDNPKIFFKLKANFMKPSLPSEDLEKIFKVIDFLLNINIENNFPTNHIIDTALCIKIYRKIDASKIFDLLKRKEFYVKYHLLYLKHTESIEGIQILYRENVIKIADKFLKKSTDFRITYNEYKERLIQKHQIFMRKNKL